MKTIAIDLDGTLAQYNGWQGEDIIGRPLPRALWAVEELIRRGYEVVIYTTRKPDRVRQWLEEYGFPSTVLIAIGSKPIAVAYIDDRAIRFEGSWDEILINLIERAWWEPTEG